MATMRSKYVPEEGLFSNSIFNQSNYFFVYLARATIMNYFRIPLNLIVVVILLKVTENQSYFFSSSCYQFDYFRIFI
jgi:hypothetical protein